MRRFAIIPITMLLILADLKKSTCDDTQEIRIEKKYACRKLQDVENPDDANCPKIFFKGYLGGGNSDKNLARACCGDRFINVSIAGFVLLILFIVIIVAFIVFFVIRKLVWNATV